jgi:hypothetical protein
LYFRGSGVTLEEWNDRRLDDLAAQVRFVASLATQVATHHAELSGLDDDVKALREAQREAIARMEVALLEVGKTCEKHTEAVRLDVREQGLEIRKLTVAQRWTPTQWAAILGPTLTALIGAAALVLSKGP